MAVRRVNKTTILGHAANYTEAWSPNATGGTVTNVGGYRIHTFTTVGSDTFKVIANLTSVEYLVVAGGGSGGGSHGGGGGAGGLKSGSLSVTLETINLSVGEGGLENATNGAGSNGANSFFGNDVSIGGGGGGQEHRAGLTGGSAGGSGGKNGTVVAGTSGQGRSGGGGSSYGAGGGGGAGSNGSSGSGNNGGNGGSGISSSITGSPVFYAGGGGGASYQNANIGIGGSSIGGNGDSYAYSGPATVGTRGVESTGSGGGGNHTGPVPPYGKKGGSGIVIIRYLL